MSSLANFVRRFAKQSGETKFRGGNPLGLIAGNGRFPIIFAESAGKKCVEII